MGDYPQPTVRVMRLYKPSHSIVQTMPPLSSPSEGLQFVIGPNFQLPDSFGEIFVGEMFSAYIAIVGTELPFNQISVSVKLQTTNELIDLISKSDDAATFAAVLNPSQYLDLIVKHRLSEQGNHTLRIVVNYLTNKNESKLLKKFYRFTVADPVLLDYSTVELNGKYFVQCQVMNMTKQILSLERIDFVPADPSVEVILLSGNSLTTTPMATESIHDSDLDFNALVTVLRPGERHAFALYATVQPNGGNIGTSSSHYQSVLGYPEIDWSASMGECGSFRGQDVLVTNKYANRVSVRCIRSPANAVLGRAFEVTIRITNHNSDVILAVLQCSKGVGRRQTLLHSTRSVNSIGDSRHSTIQQQRSGASSLSASALKSVVAPTTTSEYLSTFIDSNSKEIYFHQGKALCVTGLSCFDLGRLGAHECNDVVLSITPLMQGLQRLTDFCVADRLTGMVYTVEEDICTVWVSSDEEGVLEDETDTNNGTVELEGKIKINKFKT